MCAAYAPEVQAEDGATYNIAAALRRGRQLKCKMCKQNGAAVGCFIESCPATYHLQCAIKSGWSFQSWRTRNFFCPRHRLDEAKVQALLHPEEGASAADAAGQEAATAPSGELYCVCRQPDLGGEYFVGCSTCDWWYHPDCVGLSAADADRMTADGSLDTWRCPRCLGAAPAPLPGSKAATLGVSIAAPSVRLSLKAGGDAAAAGKLVGGKRQTPDEASTEAERGGPAHKRLRLTVKGAEDE
jgi:hypothetical protein